MRDQFRAAVDAARALQNAIETEAPPLSKTLDKHAEMLAAALDELSDWIQE